MKYANKTGAHFSAVVGDDDIASGSIAIKNMQTGEAETIPFSDLAEYINEKTKDMI